MISGGPVSKLSRVLIKVSGEGLMGNKSYGQDEKTVASVAEDVHAVHNLGVQVCLVVGGGNIYRGATHAQRGYTRVSGDYAGMLATVINALVLQNALEALGAQSRVLSALPINAVCEPYIYRKAIQHLEKSRIVIFAAGTGNPFFTTDTAATLRAIEMGCDVIMKATQVDGVYSEDPKTNPKASKFDQISYKSLLAKDLKVMDSTAVSMAQDHSMPILIFNLHTKGSMVSILEGKGSYTLVSNETKRRS